MSDYTVIADIGATLIGLLRESMGDLLSADAIALLSPAELEGQDIRLTLFLYAVSENPHLKNAPAPPAPPGIRRAPPLQVDLSYLLTAHGSRLITDRTERSLEEQRILGRAMRVLYDNSLLAGSVLKGGLAGSTAQFRINLQPLSLDDLSKIWTALPNNALKASAGYQVSPVAIDSTRSTSGKPVVERTLEYYQKGAGS
ncbi:MULTISPECIES: DUF4255 domain-containing protein [Geobacter]|uniref:Pvc16 N-terminal domain-containing protein n=2 Tax=Geobacter TaxID=28231 RepID=A0A0C1TU47_9BACT|nr:MULTISPECIES: DUF4255 domain-containing protein [Geobacter]ANA40855.1 hypothetical protein A2G06_11900 [Geobacter anodireducens]KIE42948.1 hypothetical protein SE37_10045 [Geobacter soli]MBE2887024.1 DUF4255 domain-containing protein [Geobacter anodireducens]